MDKVLAISQGNFAALTGHFPHLLLVIQGDGVIYANQRVGQILGFRAEELLAPDFNLKNIIAADQERSREETFRLLTDDRDTPSFEATLTHKNGSSVRVSLDKTRIKYGDRKAVQVVAKPVSEEANLKLSSIRETDKLVNALCSAIEAVAGALEFKDPYISEHQKRVTRLAFAISEEMHLPQKDREIIRQAAAIHDIGKIYIPLEILSKPPLLSSIDISIIRMHPEVGHSILSKLELPAPIAGDSAAASRKNGWLGLPQKDKRRKHTQGSTYPGCGRRG